MNPVINQLEKALKCKDDQELRLRVEVLLDFLKSERVNTQPQLQTPVTAAPVASQPTIQPRPTSPGSIVTGNKEQLPLKRPKGT